MCVPCKGDRNREGIKATEELFDWENKQDPTLELNSYRKKKNMTRARHFSRKNATASLSLLGTGWSFDKETNKNVPMDFLPFLFQSYSPSPFSSSLNPNGTVWNWEDRERKETRRKRERERIIIGDIAMEEPSKQWESKLKSAESAITFLKSEQTKVLQGLHQEIRRLQQKCAGKSRLLFWCTYFITKKR